jgi:hypothetical protein
MGRINVLGMPRYDARAMLPAAGVLNDSSIRRVVIRTSSQKQAQTALVHRSAFRSEIANEISYQPIYLAKLRRFADEPQIKEFTHHRGHSVANR